jgi:hypothetical protein
MDSFSVAGQLELLMQTPPESELVISPSFLGSLSFLLIVDGPIIDDGYERQKKHKLKTITGGSSIGKSAPATKAACSSWAGLDCSFRQRRDAVARCISAAILPSAPQTKGSALNDGNNTACWLLFEQDHVLMLLTPTFLDCADCDGNNCASCCGDRKLYTEHAILTKLDQVAHAAAEVHRQKLETHNRTCCTFSGHGITVFNGFSGIAHCAAFVMAQYLHAQGRSPIRDHGHGDRQGDVPLVVAELQ